MRKQEDTKKAIFRANYHLGRYVELGHHPGHHPRGVPLGDHGGLLRLLIVVDVIVVLVAVVVVVTLRSELAFDKAWASLS